MDAIENKFIQKRTFGEITLIRISLTCPVCGKTWGIKAASLEELNKDVEKGDKFICFECRFSNRKMEMDGDYYGKKYSTE